MTENLHESLTIDQKIAIIKTVTDQHIELLKIILEKHNNPDIIYNTDKEIKEYIELIRNNDLWI